MSRKGFAIHWKSAVAVLTLGGTTSFFLGSSGLPAKMSLTLSALRDPSMWRNLLPFVGFSSSSCSGGGLPAADPLDPPRAEVFDPWRLEATTTSFFSVSEVFPSPFSGDLSDSGCTCSPFSERVRMMGMAAWSPGPIDWRRWTARAALTSLSFTPRRDRLGCPGICKLFTVPTEAMEAGTVCVFEDFDAFELCLERISSPAVPALTRWKLTGDSPRPLSIPSNPSELSSSLEELLGCSSSSFSLLLVSVFLSSSGSSLPFRTRFTKVLSPRIAETRLGETSDFLNCLTLVGCAFVPRITMQSAFLYVTQASSKETRPGKT
mmetsp:Transcript_18140/g.42532  ORF Transcript_18140/g.42532 Transcript_18140/m.42532 type:complete len:320 (-) Transcript_18140:933-1892(-)